MTKVIEDNNYPIYRQLGLNYLADPLIDASNVTEMNTNSPATPVVGGKGTTYFGYSAFGVSTSDPNWLIKRVVNDGNGNITTDYHISIVQPGNLPGSLFDAIWDNRTTLQYGR